jgi:4-aminobutyrate aminotransferase-like enzyme
VPEIVEVRGKGLMLGIEFADPVTNAPDRALTSAVMEEAKAEGLLIGKGGIHGNSLRIAPALSITEEEAEQGLEKLRTAVHRARES